MAYITDFIYKAVYIYIGEERGGVNLEWFIVAEPLVIPDNNIS